LESAPSIKSIQEGEKPNKKKKARLPKRGKKGERPSADTVILMAKKRPASTEKTGGRKTIKPAPS